uniref:Uncharacterized protein n=1 Tax=Arundo donax TaxID=35708 RepID=A0A0A9E7H1_ARUDO
MSHARGDAESACR